MGISLGFSFFPFTFLSPSLSLSRYIDVYNFFSLFWVQRMACLCVFAFNFLQKSAVIQAVKKNRKKEEKKLKQFSLLSFWILPTNFFSLSVLFIHLYKYFPRWALLCVRCVAVILRKKKKAFGDFTVTIYVARF